jgi:sigma-B regulation protein RsbU (phosphoserine phosphatase)
LWVPNERFAGGMTTLGPEGEESALELYENAPCGYLSTRQDGVITRINSTLLGWLGRSAEDVVGKVAFSELLTVGGRIYYETHLAPLLQMQGKVSSIALDLRVADKRTLPILLTASVRPGPDGRPALVHMAVLEAGDRRAYERELLYARQAADANAERLAKLVTDLQRSLLPPSLTRVPGLVTASHYHPASALEVGGDFYDLFPLPDRRWGFVLGDVCGKGVDAAAITSRARYTLRASTAHDPDPSVALSLLNTILVQEQQGSVVQFCTVILGVLTPGTSGFTATIASGGHPDPLLLRPDGNNGYLPLARGPIVGAFGNATYSSSTHDLLPGDTLLLFTDGIIEARTDKSGGRYGPEDLLAFATAQTPTDAPHLVTAITELLAGFGDGIDDDIALLALTIAPPP